MVASIRNISARGVKIGQASAPPPVIPSNGLQIRPDPNDPGDMQYRAVYEAWLGSPLSGTVNYWESVDSSFAAPGATYTDLATGVTYRNVIFSTINKSQFTPQGGDPSTPNVTVEYKLGSATLSNTLILGIQVITGAPNSSANMMSQSGAMLYYKSNGVVGTYGGSFNLSPTTQTSFNGGDVIGLIFDNTGVDHFGTQSFAVFKNGVLVYAVPYDDTIYIPVGASSFSFAAGLV